MLALALGKTRQELLALIDTEELIYWQAFYLMSPFDESKYYLAQIAQVIASVYSKRKWKLEEFIFRWDAKENIKAEQEKLKAWFIARAKTK